MGENVTPSSGRKPASSLIDHMISTPDLMKRKLDDVIDVEDGAFSSTSKTLRPSPLGDIKLKIPKVEK